MKTSVVTGGASGIGLELVKLLIEDNYKVFIVDNNRENLKKLEKLLNPKHFVGIKEDMSSLSSPKKIYRKLKDENIEVLINNAGFGDYGKFYETDWEKEEKRKRETERGTPALSDYRSRETSLALRPRAAC